MPAHYEVCAPGSSGSLYLKGGNDSNFGMTLKLPTPSSNPSADADAAVTPAAAAATAASASASEGESSEDAQFDGNFRPQSVSFYVRTDNERADAGHFILGESNEVNKRVAQFQFTKDGKMGLLGTGGITHGATPYLPNRWYFIELRFDWETKQVSSPGPEHQPEPYPSSRLTRALTKQCPDPSPNQAVP